MRSIVKSIKIAILAGMLFAVSTSAGAISRDDLIDCLRGVPVDVICPAE